jgi:hypothetical protein
MGWFWRNDANTLMKVQRNLIKRHYQDLDTLDAAICWRNRKLYNQKQIAIT